MLFKKSESPLVSFAKAAVVPVLTIAGSGIAAYEGASKGVADTVEAACKGVEKFKPTFEALINKAETAEATAPAAPAASDDEIAKYKEAIKKLMAEKAEAEERAAKAEAPKAEAKPAEAPKAEAKPAEAPKKEKKEKKDDAKAESQAEAK